MGGGVRMLVGFPVHAAADAGCRVVQASTQPPARQKIPLLFVFCMKPARECTAFEVPLKAVSVLPSPVNGATHFALVSAGTCIQSTCFLSHKTFQAPRT